MKKILGCYILVETLPFYTWMQKQCVVFTAIPIFRFLLDGETIQTKVYFEAACYSFILENVLEIKACIIFSSPLKRVQYYLHMGFCFNIFVRVKAVNC